MIARTTRAVALSAGVALLATACGSSDGEDAESAVRTAAPPSPETDLFTQVEDGGAPADLDELPPDATAEIGDGTSTSVAAATTSTVDGEPSETPSGDATSSGGAGERSGTNAAAPDDLDPAGVDPVLDDRDDLDPASAGTGTGVVTIDGVAYAFTADSCIVGDGDFIVEGPGTTADRMPFWGSISASTEFDFDGDGTLDETLDILVQVGRDEPFGSASDDQPDLSATKLDGASTQLGEDLEYRMDGTRISGSGPIEDFNSVLVPLGDTLPMTFEASCT